MVDGDSIVVGVYALQSGRTLMWYFVGMLVWVVVGIIGYTAYEVFEYGDISDDDFVASIIVIFGTALIWPIVLAGIVLVGTGWLIGSTLNRVSNGRR